MDGKGKRSDNDKRPETEQARSDSLPEATRTSNVTSVTGMSGGNAENCTICGQSIHVYNTCHHLQDLICETGLMINSMDASKHVSTHAEGAAYKRLLEQGCVVIRGRSGSGKSHMGYTLLQRASKQFPRTPVKISSPDEWNYLPKSSNPKSDVTIDKYIVMIDDIFGSTNLIQHNLDQWRQKFDLVWPQVESGQIWLVITTRPEIITLAGSSFHRYNIFTSSGSILLDEKLHCLTKDEKLDFLDKLCGKYIAYEERIGIAKTDTALGFPQCCIYFASHKHIQERGLVFFLNPFEFIKQEIDSVKRSQRGSYCVLLMVLAYDGWLPKGLVKTISPPEEFTSRCKQMMKASGLKEEPNMKDILQSLCGVYLVSDGTGYQFSHRSIHDVLFVDLCESYPDLGIDLSTPSMLVEYVRTTDCRCDMLNVVVLDKEYYPKLANKLREYLSDDDSRYIVLDHPSLNDENIVMLFRGWNISMVPLRVEKNLLKFYMDYEFSTFCNVCEISVSDMSDINHIRYSYFLSYAIMSGMTKFAEHIIHKVSTATDAENQSMLDEALVCAVYMGQNRVVDVLLRKGAQPSQICLDVLSASPEMNFKNSSKLVKMIKPTPDHLKHVFASVVLHCNVTFLRIIIKMCPEILENPKDTYSQAILGLCTILNGNVASKTFYIVKLNNKLHEDISRTFSRAVDLMSLLHKAGGIMDIDEMFTLATQKYAPDTLIEFIRVGFQIPPAHHDDIQSSVCHSKKFHQLLESLIDKLAPVQIKARTVKTLLHKAAWSQCKICIKMLISDVEETDSDGNTALHCMIKSDENHDHEVLELLIEKTNHRHIKNKSGELPLHIAARRQCQECISHLLMEADVSKDHAGNPVHCTFDEGASYHRDESREHVFHVGKGSDVIMRQTKTPCIERGELLQPISDINDQDEAGNTALHYLHPDKSYYPTKVEHFCQETCHLFLDNGADVHIKNKGGKTALHLAAKANCERCVKILLPISDINDQDEVGNTALHYLIHNESYHYRMNECLDHETYQLFLDSGADVQIKNNEGKTALHLAAKANCERCAKYLLPISDINDQDELGNTALHYLIHNESYHYGMNECLAHETYQLFLDSGADVHIKNKEGKTALHLAAKAHCKNCVEMLLPISDINDQDEVGNNALHYLIHNESYHYGRNECLAHETYQLFLDNGADVHIKNKEGKTALHLAAKANCKNCVEMLLPMSHINDQDEVGDTVLHYLHHYQSYYPTKVKRFCHETYQLFLDNGADVTIKDKKGQTALHLAAKANCKNCVEMLLPMSDINDQDELGNTALHSLHHYQIDELIIVERVCQETCQIFLDNGADVHIKNKEGKTALHLAAKANCKNCVEMLLPMFDINDQDEVGNTALHYLIHNVSYFDGSNECLDHETYQLFLDNGADVHIKNKEGKTALHSAAKANCKKCVEMLLPMSDINDQDELGNTALHYLNHYQSYGLTKVDRVCQETCQIFLDNGADVHIKNKDGKTALHLAAKANCKICVEMLLPMSHINDQDEVGNTALYYLNHYRSYYLTKIERVCQEMCQIFLDNGADVHIKNKEGKTSLHFAAKANCTKCVEMLLPMLDINEQDWAGDTELHYLMHNESYFDGRNECLDHETYQLFLDNGADVHIKNKKVKTALHLAAKASCKNCVEMLLPMSDLNEQDWAGNTALHYLIHKVSYFDERKECLDHETYQLFLDNGADVHKKNKEGKTALHFAAKANCERCVKMLLPMSDVNDKDEAGNTALHYLIHKVSYFYELYHYGKEECLGHETYQLFLDIGADVTMTDSEGKTALHLAAKANCKRCVKMLLPMSDINDKDEAGNTALHYLIYNESYYKGMNECLAHETYQLFLDNGADVTIKDKKGQTGLLLAAMANCERCVKILLPISDINDQDELGNTALHYLIHNVSYRCGRKDCLDHDTYQLFLDNGADVNIKNKEGKTALHLAAKANCERCVKILLPISDINDQDEVGNTALHYLIHKESYQYVWNTCLAHETYQLFLDNGADVHIQNKEGQTVLSTATWAHCKNCVEMLLPVLDINDQDKVGDTALHFLHHYQSYHLTKVERVCQEMCQLFLANRADVHVKNKEGKTYLHLAAKANCKKCVEMLLPMFDINDQDQAGNTALHYLIHNVSYFDGSNECLDHETYQLFLDNGADVHIKNNEGKTALHLAVKANCERCVKILLPISDINDQDELGNTALHYLIHNVSYRCGRKDCLDHTTYQLFLDNGADVNIKNKEGKTALHLAAKANCERCVKILLPISDINDQDEVGNTALHYLIHNESYQYVWNTCLVHETYQLFLDSGLDVHIKNNEGKTALHVAAKAKCERCVKMLLPKSDINYQDELGNTALHYLIHYESYDYGRNECLAHETYKLFLDSGADVHMKNKEGETALHLAALANCKNCVEKLLTISDINDQDEVGNTALHYVIHNESHHYGRNECLDHDTYQLFLDSGADVHIKNKEGTTALHLAAKANCERCVKIFLPMSDVNDQDELGNTALHYLIHNETYYYVWNKCLAHEIYQLFLDSGLDVHIKNKEGKTALHLAAKGNCETCFATIV
ncbi:uncharacterized protein LOC124125868 isoform X2 [Haliotis rufescens]|uniref:uncharacterized protein LOC124125868 isoform X2 n=1 Tax=Haliotis rufescens TaxID=6454 RepID=UPI00201FA0AB|nr:uncharacterized protein LOC124125868 isoform X2 [Haliotis rufescens]